MAWGGSVGGWMVQTRRQIVAEMEQQDVEADEKET